MSLGEQVTTVAIAQGKRGIWMFIFPDGENTLCELFYPGNFASNTGKNLIDVLN